MAEVPLYRGEDFRRACDVRPSQGVSHEPAWRSQFWRDRARLIHSAAFRRLQGKTQLFAGLESDFFRNRLTHSLEVAQIAKSICRRLNSAQTDSDLLIDEDLVEFAGLAHDLGHPPFGHTGEEVLDAKMRAAGGFEGNAQTLRILCRLEKKLDDGNAQIDDQGPIWYRNGKDAAAGLNLCSRTLASVIKYDAKIPFRRDKSDKLRKGYYRSEAPVVAAIKHDVGVDPSTKLYLVECQIMDLADDIAYSTCDLEDAFKGGLLTPLDVLYPDNLTTMEVADRAKAELGTKVDGRDVREVLRTVLSLDAPSEAPPKDWHDWFFTEVGQAWVVAKNTASLGFFRTHLTSFLVNRFIQAVDLQLDTERPAQSIVTMRRQERLEMSILKQLTYVLLINSPRLRLVAHRGETVVRTIFDALTEPRKGARLLPPDYHQRYQRATPAQQPRVVCDFIAGMTDRYATEFYARLTSDVFTTMFKPL